MRKQKRRKHIKILELKLNLKNMNVVGNIEETIEEFVGWEIRELFFLQILTVFWKFYEKNKENFEKIMKHYWKIPGNQNLPHLPSHSMLKTVIHCICDALCTFRGSFIKNLALAHKLQPGGKQLLTIT